jgi:hypothetical protein
VNLFSLLIASPLNYLGLLQEFGNLEIAKALVAHSPFPTFRVNINNF